MQFDEKDLGHENDNFSLEEDSNSISWEDLLNADEDVNLDELIKSGDKKEETEKESAPSISDFDIASLADNAEQEAEQEEIKEEPAPAADFDLSAAANAYVNTLDADEAEIEQKEEPAPVDLSEEGILGIVEDKLLLEDSNDNNIQINGDLSDVVDDELLNLLDVKNEDKKPSVEDVLTEEPEQKFSNDDALDSLDILSDDKKEDDKTPVKTPYEPQNDIREEQEEILAQKPKSKVPVLLFVVIFVIGVAAAAAFFVFNFFSGASGAGGEDIALNPESNYNMSDDLNDAEVQKQTEELINKVEIQNQENKDKENKEDKEKVEVQVPVGGRINPFVPSSLFDDKGFATVGADLSMPPDVDINSPEVVAARKLLTISVSGIMYDPSKPSAILKFDNMDYFVQKGDRIDTYTVNQITKDYVAIKNGANVYKAYVGESFKINEEIPASKQMQMNAGQRQYISADDIQISTK